MLPAAAYLAGLPEPQSTDVVLTNWNKVGHESMDFGRGPPTSLDGYFGVQRGKMITIVSLSQDALGIRIPLDGLAALQRLRSSSVLTMTPQSGLLEE